MLTTSTPVNLRWKAARNTRWHAFIADDRGRVEAGVPLCEGHRDRADKRSSFRRRPPTGSKICRGCQNIIAWIDVSPRSLPREGRAS